MTNARDHLFFFGLFNLLLPTTISDSNLECLTSPLPDPSVREWQNSLAGNITVIWSIDRVCRTVEQCFSVSNFNAINYNVSSWNLITTQQLPPVQIQPNEFISFQSGSFLGDDVVLVYHAVDETGFAGCDLNSGTALNATNQTVVLSVANGLLQTGNNYFIANSVPTSYYQCSPYGLRLNLTVQPEQCITDQSGTELCSGNGRCLAYPYQSFYTCHCCPGFIGQFCERVDGCYNITCHYGGTCNQVQLFNDNVGFNCACRPGFTGRLCEEGIGVFCSDNECMNFGACLKNNTPPFFTCYCQLGYTGKVCETQINECDPNPCIGGTCVDGLASYTCQCNQDFTGLNCETYIGVCPVGRCLNSGSCIPLNKTNSLCLCLPGYTGDSCETRVMICDSNPCVNHTDCVDYGDRYVCVCNPGFSGFQCELEIDECASNPCKNNGTCIERLAGWSCICPSDFVQPACDISGSDSYIQQTKILHDAEFGLEILAGVLGILFFIAAIVLLIYCCKLHKIYKHLCCQNKYVHIVDETYGPAVDMSDVTGAYPSPDFISDTTSTGSTISDTTSTGSMKTPVVRRGRRKQYHKL